LLLDKLHFPELEPVSTAGAEFREAIDGLLRSAALQADPAGSKLRSRAYACQQALNALEVDVAETTMAVEEYRDFSLEKEYEALTNARAKVFGSAELTFDTLNALRTSIGEYYSERGGRPPDPAVAPLENGLSEVSTSMGKAKQQWEAFNPIVKAIFEASHADIQRHRLAEEHSRRPELDKWRFPELETVFEQTFPTTEGLDAVLESGALGADSERALRTCSTQFLNTLRDLNRAVADTDSEVKRFVDYPSNQDYWPIVEARRRVVETTKHLWGSLETLDKTIERYRAQLGARPCDPLIKALNGQVSQTRKALLNVGVQWDRDRHLLDRERRLTQFATHRTRQVEAHFNAAGPGGTGRATGPSPQGSSQPQTRADGPRSLYPAQDQQGASVEPRRGDSANETGLSGRPRSPPTVRRR